MQVIAGQVFTITIVASSGCTCSSEPRPISNRWDSFDEWRAAERRRLEIERLEREAAVYADTLAGWRALVREKSGIPREPGPPRAARARLRAAPPPRSQPRGARLGLRNYARR